MTRRTPSVDARGFSLVEVMIALIIICVGMLGIAKLEAVVLSNTGTSRVRALVALQASSLADMIHADRDFWNGTSGDWTTNPLTATASVQSGAITLSAGNSSTLSTALGPPPTDCTAASCSPVNLAGYDFYQWANNGLSQVLKNSTSTVTCSSASGAVTCTIQIVWSENTEAANQQEAAATTPTAFQTQTYSLVVEP
jgi:type IV pilus assembly protein PilV